MSTDLAPVSGKPAKTRRPDSIAAAATALARACLDQIAGPGTVGEHLGAEVSGERLVTHRFACLAKAYPGWEWAVSLARAPRAKVATVCEAGLVATTRAVVAPEHVPWQDRLQPGDLSPGDVLERIEDDPRLVAGFEATGQDDVDEAALWELGLGRARVLSRVGREEAADRWQTGDFGPASAYAQGTRQHCGSCGFLMPVTGALRPMFGVCANEWSPADGRVVSLGYGCGAHSESELLKAIEAPVPHVLDEVTFDAEDRGGAVSGDASDRTFDDEAPAPAEPDSVDDGRAASL